MPISVIGQMIEWRTKSNFYNLSIALSFKVKYNTGGEFGVNLPDERWLSGLYQSLAQTQHNLSLSC